MVLMNLTDELNRTTLLIPGRLSEVLSVLEPLEKLADFNQITVDTLTQKVHNMAAYSCNENTGIH